MNIFWLTKKGKYKYEYKYLDWYSKNEYKYEYSSHTALSLKTQDPTSINITPPHKKKSETKQN